MKKATIDRDDLTMKLKLVAGFIPAKAVIEAYKEVLLTFSDDRVYLSGGGEESQLSCMSAAKVAEPFSVCLPARVLLSIIDSYKDQQITFVDKSKADGSPKVEIRAGKSRCIVSGTTSPNDFFKFTQPAFTSEMFIPQQELKKALSACRVVISPDAPNQAFQVVGIKMMGDKIVFYGSSSVLVSRIAVQPISVTQWSDICLSDESAKKIVNAISDKGEATVMHDGNSLGVSFFLSKDPMDEVTLITKASLVKYPDIEKAIMSRKPESSFLVNCLELKDSVRRLKLFAMDGVVPCVAISNKDMANIGELTATIVDEERGNTGEEIISLKNENGLIYHKLLNAEVLNDALSQIQEDWIRVYFEDNRDYVAGEAPKPSFIYPEGNEGQCFIIQGMSRN